MSVLISKEGCDQHLRGLETPLKLLEESACAQKDSQSPRVGGSQAGLQTLYFCQSQGHVSSGCPRGRGKGWGVQPTGDALLISAGVQALLTNKHEGKNKERTIPETDFSDISSSFKKRKKRFFSTTVYRGY